MKTCTCCNKIKRESEFNFKIKSRGTLQLHCRSCSRIYVRNHYKNNTEYYLNKARRRNKKFRAILRKYLWNYLKNHPCTDCGEKDPTVLEFDHIRDKDIAVSMLVKYASMSRMVTEVEKCEVRCANCHRRKTAIQFGYYKNLPL